MGVEIGLAVAVCSGGLNQAIGSRSMLSPAAAEKKSWASADKGQSSPSETAKEKKALPFRQGSGVVSG